MREVSMAALAAPVHKPDFFQVGNQPSHFARHFSIKVVSQSGMGARGQRTVTKARFTAVETKPFQKPTGRNNYPPPRCSLVRNHQSGTGVSLRASCQSAA